MSVYAPNQPQDIRNRTVEFQQCVNTFNKRNKAHQFNQQTNTTQQPLIKRSEFQSRASNIAKDISHTSDLLGKLALLAKKKPLFDDKPIEISELTYVIKQDIVKIEKNLKNLQDYLKTGNESSNEELKTNSKNIVQLLNTKMKNVSGNFKEVLETRQKNEMENRSRKEKFFSTLQQQQQQNGQATTFQSDNPFLNDPAINGNGGIPGNGNEENNALLSLPQDQQLQLLEEQSSQYLQERHNAVETIESTINEVGNLFQQLATMVSEQSEVIQRIDNNVEDIDLNIQGAQRELFKYFNNISNNRWMFLKIFGILIIFFILWILVN
ncbi:Syntaxin-5 [Wickerhamomyces ciferrii]|uniref:Syntaxin-5 n=1 Tax=Wickerhamomyces ciferrii (strain ATCC 14091 / BCRC 22168 / CBS 111 / JCM 3599 / NBRC 0793 / NRRL Y-1031 F-60-10) TaxID=1206466 RepID=K0KS71_WICCF|nr:Syntaxin-5 [Wickerhamomyces ciferrii]CCH44842.1 Syntaxin-5 [Wickerhamomyces ciferrii]